MIERLRKPKVEIAIVAEMNCAPLAPSQVPATAAAGVSVAARPASPSVRRYATFASR